MQECSRCGRKEDSVKLLDVISSGEIEKICEECALTEELPIIRRPTSYQLQESEKPYTVRQRLAKMAGVKLKENVQDRVTRDMKAQAGVCEIKGITLDKLRPAKDYSKIIHNRQELAKKANKPVDLVDNWNWHIQMARRNRKMTLVQIATIIGESELVLKMLEQGNLADDAVRIIAKLEQFFKIKLRKSEAVKEQERIQDAVKTLKAPARIINFNKTSLQNLTISDLKKMKDAREHAEKEDKELASKLAWQGLKKKEEKKESLIGKDIELVDEEQN